jgi:hypothetical protein
VQTATQLAFIQEFETQYAHQNCVYPYAAAAIPGADSGGGDPAVSVDVEGVRLKTIDMSVEDEILCQLELEADEYASDTHNGHHQHHHPHYTMVPKAVRITSAYLCQALYTEHGGMVGLALGGVTTSIDVTVAECDIRQYEVYANQSRWDAWKVFSRDNAVCKEHILQCSYLLLDWLESRADSLFSPDAVAALQDTYGSVMTQAEVAAEQFPQWWFCHGDVISAAPSPRIKDSGGPTGGEELGRALAESVDLIDGVLRRHMSR